MKYYRLSWMWVAILFCALSFNACSDNNDNPSTPSKPEVIEASEGFFTAEINKLIDANYPEVVANGYAKLIIPKTMYKEGLFTFPTNASNDMKCMVDAGFKAYVNGGSVRDAILGKPSHDIDFSTNASIDQIVATVPNAKAFNAFRNIWVVKAYHDGDIETDIAPIFAIFPELSGKANVPVLKNTDSPYSEDLLEDTYSRDFTFNSLYYDYGNGNIIDYHGGLRDLREGLVNTVVEANLKVSTDPRCILRGLRFAAKYDFKVGDAFDKALKEHAEASLATLDTYNAVYNMESGFNGAFALKYYDLLYEYKVAQFFWTSLKAYFGTSEYDNLVRGLLGELDRQGKADMALPLAAIFWPRFAADIKAKENPTASDVKAVWEAIDKENAANYKFDYKDYTYIPQFIQDVWYLQLQMADSANQTADKAAEIRKAERFADALRLLKARAALDSSLSSLVEFWS